ncbi:MAG TPA: NAD(P)/FAD-dependent oxidoreductase [Niabella sp.]|nr:NAD(P)/FAD-dependent oxidoreductase [Niabella sp.]HOZ96606.1 NAD(P)/FAD-dependent oxidoreductase [Niabella sp.]HQW14526.1 NAD(P)/FAD-dependent oxidoreductase [Niabella sp.]HQX19941.1 NAD(P)/FAD-dependent oxidoreductase [Niabella sp.]HQX41182.1 NAD(P)/FAD-dependent oxidoreductase [Niabella sp.]
MVKRKNPILNSIISILNDQIEKRNIDSEEKRSQNKYDRRSFLKEGGLGSIGVALTLSLPAIFDSCRSNPKESDENILDIAILGAGIAGLNCANHLLKSGLQFQIFEASHRIGGRILTHYNDSLGLGIFPEFGGDFIDSDHKDMLALAKEFDLELIDLIEEQESKKLIKDIYYFDNRIIEEKEIINEFVKIADKIARDRTSLGEDYNTPMAVELDNMPLSAYISALPCKTWLKDLLMAAFVAEYGLDCDDQSTLNFLDLIETDTSAGFKVFGESDERYRIMGGNSKIIDGLLKKIGPEKVQKGQEVNEIQELQNGSYLIRFSNQKEVKARAIVCTIPFTILRKIKLNLRQIPSEKRRCIDELGYGMNTKLVLGYEGTPWSDSENRAMGYLFHKEIVNGWDSSYNKTANNQNGTYVTYFGGRFSENLNSISFKNKMAPPTHIWKTALPEKTVSGIVEELGKIFKHSKEKFLNKHVFVNWIDFPWAKGSYSCYKPGQWTSIAGWEMKPVGNFFFAGEHCSEMFQGFMNGAAETGKRAAQQALTKIKVEKS